MSDLLHQRGAEKLISTSNREALIEYAEAIVTELPEGCAACPAAYLCAVALNEDGLSFPRTPNDIRHMKIRRSESGGYSMLSGQAQFALKSIVSEANEHGTGPNDAGDVCCLDPDTRININKADLYSY